MLHLHPGIDLDEIKRPGIGVHEKFRGAGVAVTGGGRQPEGVAAEFVALPGIEIGRRGALHDLLVAALHRAVAFEEVDQVAVGIAKDLHLDVAGALHQFLQVNLVVAESRKRLSPRHRDFLPQARRIPDHPHAPSAAAPTGLEHQRIADGFGQFVCGVGIVGQGIGGRHHRNAGGLRQRSRAHLVADTSHHVGWRTDKDHPGLAAGLRELGVLGKKPVSWVHGVDPGLPGDAQDGLDIQVGAQCLPGFAHRVALIRLEPVQRETVFVRIDSDGTDAEFGRRAHHAYGDLAAVGNEQFPDLPGH